jgi:hypothetical protein
MSDPGLDLKPSVKSRYRYGNNGRIQICIRNKEVF